MPRDNCTGNIHVDWLESPGFVGQLSPMKMRFGFLFNFKPSKPSTTRTTIVVEPCRSWYFPDVVLHRMPKRRDQSRCYRVKNSAYPNTKQMEILHLDMCGGGGAALFVISCLFRPNSPGERKPEWIILQLIISNVSIYGCSEERK